MRFCKISRKCLASVLALMLTSCCTDETCMVDGMNTAADTNEVVAGSNLDIKNMNFRASIGDRVYFSLDSEKLGTATKTLLQSQADWLRNNPHKVVIEGYCDDRGTSEYNMGLGARRANAVKEFLAMQGVPLESMEVISYGKDNPIDCAGSLEEVRRQNRVVITVINDEIKN